MFIMSYDYNTAININQITNMHIGRKQNGGIVQWVLYIDTTCADFIIYNKFDNETDAKNALRSLVDTLNLGHKVNY